MTKKKDRPLVNARRELPLDANALELFARIVAAGSFAHAARQLGQTRAAVSRRVAAIEAALGQPLFVRTTRALGLTEAGRRLAAKARAVAEASDAARLAWRAQGEADGGLGGTLRLTAVPTVGHTVLAPLLARFQALHPALRIELSLTNRRVDLLREDIDVAFRITRQLPPDWVARPLLPFTVHAYAAPCAPLQHPAELTARPTLLLGNPADSVTLHWRHGRSGDEVAIELRPACVADDLGTLVLMAQHGPAIVLATDFTVRDEVAAGRLIDVLPGWQLHLPEGDTVYALTLPRPAAPEAARALVQFVAEALGAG